MALHEKSNAPSAFKDYQETIERYIVKKIKFVRTDKGGCEFYRRYIKLDNNLVNLLNFLRSKALP